MKIITLSLISILGSLLFVNYDISTPLPVTFQNDLISLSIINQQDTLLFYTDTGGKNLLYKSGTKKLGIKPSGKNLWNNSGFETLLMKNDLPIPDEKKVYFVKDNTTTYDGMLGREWFANKSWRFDYPNKTLKHINSSGDAQEVSEQTTRLFFKSDSLGNHTHHLARIQVVVESDTLSMLFDTGAQAYLSKEAQEKLNKNELVATSFINSTTFLKWKTNHPEWIVLHGGDLSFGKEADMIIVPTVQIGDKTIGPVEFAKREDSNFKVMSNFFMDNEIVGAIGGNALSQLNVFTVDYKQELLIIGN